MSIRILMVVNAEWYFWSHRLPIARALRDRGYEVVIAAAVERQLDQAIRDAGFRFVPLRMIRGRLTPASELRTIRDLARLYRAERPTVVYHTTIKPILYGAVAARLAGITRVVNAVPGLGHMFASANITRTIVSRAYRFALRGPHTRVIFQHEDDRQMFHDLDIVSRDRSVVIRGSGVDVDAFTPSPEPDTKVPIVLLASRLVWDKGIRELAEAARGLQARGTAARVVFVGAPDMANPGAVPESQLRAWHDEGIVEWWGLRNDMPDVIRQAAIVSLPSYYREGVPKILLEAAASGRPIVTTDWPGCRDVVRHGENGLLVPPRDVPALTDALASLLQNRDVRRQMGMRGRLLAEREFAEEHVVKQTVAIFDDLLRH